MIIIPIPHTNSALVIRNHRQRILACSTSLEHLLRVRNRPCLWTWGRVVDAIAPLWERH